MGKRILPAWVAGSIHEWRSKKRRDLREAKKALEKARRGCALTPAGTDIVEALHKIDNALAKCSVKEWGR